MPTVQTGFFSVSLSNHHDGLGAYRRAKTVCNQNAINEERTILTLNKSAINSKLHETKKGKHHHKVELRLTFFYVRVKIFFLWFLGFGFSIFDFSIPLRSTQREYSSNHLKIGLLNLFYLVFKG